MHKLQDYKNRHLDQTINIIGCGASLWNWMPVGLLGNPCICLNSSIHYLMGRVTRQRLHNVYRIMMDPAAIINYQGLSYYGGDNPALTPSVLMPQVPTFFNTKLTKDFTREEANYLNRTEVILYDHSLPTVLGFDFGDNGKLWRPTLFAAISLALYMGAVWINLIGFDFGVYNGKRRWDDDGELFKHDVRSYSLQKDQLDLLIDFIKARLNIGNPINRLEGPHYGYEGAGENDCAKHPEAAELDTEV